MKIKSKVYIDTIHADFCEMKRSISLRPLKATTAATSSTTFLPKVSQLVSTTASPKQPQSDTGSARARYSVSGVIKHISSNASHEAMLRRMPRNRNTPTQNSMPASPMPKNNATIQGTHADRPNASR